jgi:hypothetical protein
MKAYADNSPVLVEKLQGGTLINFNAVQVTKETPHGTKIEWEYDQVKVSANPTNAEIIEAVMASKYSTGAEIACINNKESKPEEYAAYQAFRIAAKELAEQVLIFRQKI